MKKVIFVATLCVAGLMNAKSNVQLEKDFDVSEKVQSFKLLMVYNPIKVTSSCGYTEFINLGGSSMSCLEVEIDRMEEECIAPFEGWGYC
ncbi:hypothetical protein ACM39_09180 [Chryseobacterium sp. FH2]|uniref:hypothetical protein n=1 Tax=Chryseobacterium sp. FH2 TaxID=1674291 RepID=UPI00065B00D3|nr:hypothetical protein [Chryseobacterium sp. FH2]KMQ68030.1 hypothetical protein ACM39_09180 [Chryseobacterium sp. FH2]